MIKSKIIDFFFKKKTCDLCTSIKLENFYENPKIKDYEK